ncbi:DUF6890 family protein [Klebsiella grimontii]|uniref:DUF6890 family protein n=1 Tax=Klebsiella grimontii TaxID=2058152 RepID=UPI0037431BC9
MRRHFLPHYSDSEESPDSALNIGRARWLAEYFHEQQTNATSAGFSYAMSGKKS